jgi:hypothetical protein
MLSGVRMIGIGCLEKLLKVISILPRLALEVTLLVIMPLITAGGDRDSLPPPPLRPPLVAFGAPVCAITVCLERHPSTATGSRLPIVLDEDGPNLLLTRGVPGRDVEELLHGLWLVTTELMH